MGAERIAVTATSTFYQACAEQSLRDADASILANVRSLHLHSAEAWQAMADRTAKIEASRRERQDAGQTVRIAENG